LAIGIILKKGEVMKYSYNYNVKNFCKHYTIVNTKNNLLFNAIDYHLKRTANIRSITRFLELGLKKIIQQQEYNYLLKQKKHFIKFNEIHLGMTVFNQNDLNIHFNLGINNAEHN